MVKCALCNKEIENETEAIKLSKGGKIYYFCSEEHLDEFLKLTSTPSC
ncbi:MAG: YHS domain-containing protein [Candidatus Njordarchaeia archaeon]